MPQSDKNTCQSVHYYTLSDSSSLFAKPIYTKKSRWVYQVEQYPINVHIPGRERPQHVSILVCLSALFLAPRLLCFGRARYHKLETFLILQNKTYSVKIININLLHTSFSIPKVLLELEIKTNRKQ